MPRRTRLLGIATVAASIAVAFFLWRPDLQNPPQARRSTRPPPPSSPALHGRTARSDLGYQVAVRIRCEAGFPVDSVFLLTVVAGESEADSLLGFDGMTMTARLTDPDRARPLTIQEAALLSPTEARVVLAPVPPMQLSVALRRADGGEPYLYSEPTEVAVPRDSEVIVSLRTKAGTGLLRVLVTAQRPLLRARVQVREGAQFTRSVDLMAPKSGPTTQLEGSLVVPGGSSLTVGVSEYDPGAQVLGVPAPQTIWIDPGSIGHLRFELPRGAVVTIAARNAHGEAIPSYVSVWSVGGTAPVPVPSAGAMDSEGGGRFWRTLMLPGTYLVLVTPEASYAAGWQAFRVLDESQVPVDVLVSDEGMRVRLEVRDAAGRPLGRKRVNLNRIAATLEGALAIISMTDDNGILVTPPIAEGNYLAVLWDYGLAAELSIDGDGTHRLTLPERPAGTGSVHGTLVRGDGQRGQFVTVYLEVARGWFRTADADAAGDFRFEDLAPGTYRILVHRSWFGTAVCVGWEGTVRVDADRVSDLEVPCIAPP